MPGLNPEAEEYLKDQYDRYGFLSVIEISDTEFAWRRLTRGEYKRLVELDLSSSDSEEWICAQCCVYPQGYDFENCLSAGIPTTLARAILEGSYFTDKPVPIQESPGHKLLQMFRLDMDLFENQVDCIIAEAFPSLSIEEIANWPVDKAMFYLSRAEWTLRQLRGLPIVEIRPEDAKPEPVQKHQPTPKSRVMAADGSPIQQVPTTKQIQ
jgi:hypothetical protein